MSQLFLINQQFSSDGSLVPAAIPQGSWCAMPYGIEGIVLLCCDPQTLAGSFAFPVNLDQQLPAVDVTNVQTYFAANNIPSSYVSTAITWRTLAQIVAKTFQIAQRNAGLNGVGIFTTNTTASLAAQSQAIKSNSVVPPAPAPVGIQPTLSASVSAHPTLMTNLQAVAASFGFDSSSITGSVESAIVSLGSQFTAPLVMDRGDGFRL